MKSSFIRISINLQNLVSDCAFKANFSLGIDLQSNPQVLSIIIQNIIISLFFASRLLLILIQNKINLTLFKDISRSQLNMSRVSRPQTASPNKSPKKQKTMAPPVSSADYENMLNDQQHQMSMQVSEKEIEIERLKTTVASLNHKCAIVDDHL